MRLSNSMVAICAVFFLEASSALCVGNTDPVIFFAKARDESLRRFTTNYTYESEGQPDLLKLAKALGSTAIENWEDAMHGEDTAWKDRIQLDCTLIVEQERWRMEVEDILQKKSFSIVFDGTLFYVRDNNANRGQILTSFSGSFPRLDEFVFKIPNRYDFKLDTLGSRSYLDILTRAKPSEVFRIGGDSIDHSPQQFGLSFSLNRGDKGLPPERFRMTFNEENGIQLTSLKVDIELEPNTDNLMPVVECVFEDFYKEGMPIGIPRKTVIKEMKRGPAGMAEGMTPLFVRKHMFNMKSINFDKIDAKTWNPPFKRGDQVYDQLADTAFIVGNPLDILIEEMKNDVKE